MRTSLPTRVIPPVPRRTGVILSVAGLFAWLAALILAVASPILGFQIPAPYLLAAVVFSAVFSIMSLPHLLETDRDSEKRAGRPAARH